METQGISVCIYIKVRHEWEKVETFMSKELNYLGSGGWECERECVKGGRRYLRQQCDPSHRANPSVEVQWREGKYVCGNEQVCWGAL